MDRNMSVGSTLLAQQAEDRLLVDRVCLAAKIVLVVAAGVFVAELMLRPGERLGVSLTQGINLVGVASLLALVRSAAHRRRNLLVAFAGYVLTSICVGAVGTFSGDLTTALIVLLTVALGAATLLPWGIRWQLPGVVVTAAVAVVTVWTLVDSPPDFWLENLGVFFPALIASVAVARVLERQRALVVSTDNERAQREASLREAKERLEEEVEKHRLTEEALRFALRELDHRVKNTLAMVQSIAQSTLETSQSREEFSQAFYGRIQALARVYTALAERRWTDLRVRQLIEMVVSPYASGDDRVSIVCDGGSISSDLVRSLSLALHELSTNAAKYGALSTGEGRVAISSRIEVNAGSHLHLLWQEFDGPAVVRPARRGLGTRLIEDGLAYESGGWVDLQFLPSGVRCEIDIPLPTLSAA
jgi:two-component sensor histidine kinase